MDSCHWRVESTDLLQQESQTYSYIEIVEGFGSTGTITRFGERFRDGQYSLVTFFCSSTLGAPVHAQSFVKVRVTCPNALWSRRHFRWTVLHQKELKNTTAIQSESTVSQGLFSKCLS